MITDEQIKSIVYKDVLDIGEVFEIIQRYIYDRKNFILDIQPLIKILNTQQGIFMYRTLFLHLRNISFAFFIIQFNLEEYLLFHPKN